MPDTTTLNETDRTIDGTESVRLATTGANWKATLATIQTWFATIIKNALGAVSTDGLVLTNNTAAALGAQQWSPRLRLTGQGWSTGSSASQTTDWIIETRPVQGNPPVAGLVFSNQVAGGGYTNILDFGVTNSGNWTTPGSWNINSLAVAAAGNMQFSTRSRIQSPADGAVRFLDQNQVNSFTFSFPTATATPTLQLGSADAASPVAQIVQAQGSRSGTDTNVGGASVTVKPGTGTGTGAAASLVLQAPIPVASGTGAQTQTTGATINRGSTIVGPGAALATTATDGFLYIPTCAGPPTGTPTTQTGTVALIYDTTNDQLYVYRGGWKQPKTPAGAAIVTWQ